MQAHKLIHAYTPADNQASNKKLSPKERQAVIELLTLSFNKDQLGSITIASELLASYKQGYIDEATCLASLVSSSFFSLISKEAFIKAFAPKDEPALINLELQDIWQAIRSYVGPIAQQAKPYNSTLSILASLTQEAKEEISASLLEDIRVIRGAHANKVANLKQAAQESIKEALVSQGINKAEEEKKLTYFKELKAAKEKGKWIDIEEQEARGWTQEQQNEYENAALAYAANSKKEFKKEDLDKWGADWLS